MFDDLGHAVEYAGMYANYLREFAIGEKPLPCERGTQQPIDRETYYWEFIARPFARSHGCAC